ncbi:MAG: GTP pyrophosphokinase [Candidatus Rokuibacteriota bacterium]|nr:MAG: GTP pyrophosphokinase [Candidatus Rokubacteria bacterium]
MSTLERAIQIAASAHQRQFDKGGSPYFLHPLRVMLRLKSEPDRIVAVLHDVLEDTAWTAAQLVEEGFAPGVMTALDALCRRKDESYDDFIDRVSTSQIAIRVKLADLEDNMDLSRIPTPTRADHERLGKYRRAYSVLLGHLV